jgi:hypothetical protein
MSTPDDLSEEEKSLLIQQILKFPKQLGGIDFKLLVKQSTQFDVIEMNQNNPYDQRLLLNLNRKLQNSLNTSKKTGRYYAGNRINDVGSRIEADIVNDLNSSPFSVRQLVSKGYPDTEITFENETVYMELKATGIIEKSSYRHFYYTTGTKIKKVARHILLIILAESHDRGYWAVKSFIISDLSKLKVRLKAEFNASKSDLIRNEARLISIP